MTQGLALLLTWLLELPVALLITRRFDLRFVVVVVVCSAVTHPFVWWIGTHIERAWWWPSICAVELLVGVVESLMLWRLAPLPLRRAFAAGLAMNAFSFGVGVLITPWFS